VKVFDENKIEEIQFGKNSKFTLRSAIENLICGYLHNESARTQARRAKILSKRQINHAPARCGDT